MKKWIYDGGFVAHIMHDDGTQEVKQFTSSAQARQFVEKKNNDHTTHKRHPFNRTMFGLRIRRNSQVKSDSELTPDQKLLKAKALEQMKGL